MTAKADYVRAHAPAGAFGHTCHWPGCAAEVPPAMWGCKAHWYRLPFALRQRIWRAYEPGQEITKRPSAQYLAVAKDVEAWIAANAAPDLFASAPPAPQPAADQDHHTAHRGAFEREDG